MKIFLALLALAAVPAARAQSVPQQAAQAVHPPSQAILLPYEPMRPAGASALTVERDDWKASNTNVGQYRRGHIDILRWEKAQEAGRQPSRESTR